MSILIDFFVRENVRSLVIRNNRFVASNTATRIFTKGWTDTRECHEKMETEEKKEGNDDAVLTDDGGESRSVNEEYGAAF